MLLQLDTRLNSNLVSGVGSGIMADDYVEEPEDDLVNAEDDAATEDADPEDDDPQSMETEDADLDEVSTPWQQLGGIVIWEHVLICSCLLRL